MACNLCAPGYFGDAVLLKDCQSKDFMNNTVVSVNFLSSFILFKFRAVRQDCSMYTYSNNFTNYMEEYTAM